MNLPVEALVQLKKNKKKKEGNKEKTGSEINSRFISFCKNGLKNQTKQWKPDVIVNIIENISAL